MVVVHRRVVLLLILAMCLLSIVLRYPLVEHERNQADSYSLHMFANAIINDGYAVWTFHFLSYLGYYPLSYPSGAPFLYAESSLITGIGIEESILLVNYILAILFCLAVFCLSRVFLPDSRSVLLAVFFAICGARFVDTTYWVGSARGPLVVMALLCLVALFRATTNDKRLLYGIAALLIFSCVTLHHMAVLLLLFGVAYIMALVAGRFLRARTGTRTRGMVAVYYASVGLGITVVSFAFLDYFGELARMNLESSSLLNIEHSGLSILVNIGIAYTVQIGIIAPIAVLAIISVLRGTRLGTLEMYSPTLLLVFIPLLGNQLYVSMMLLPFAAILGTYLIRRQWFRRGLKKHLLVFLSLLILSTLFLPVWSTERWNSERYRTGDMVEVDSTVFNDGAYLRSNFAKIELLSNSFVLPVQLASQSEAAPITSGVPLVLSGHINSSNLRENLIVSKARFPLYPYFTFEYEGERDVDLYVLILMHYGASIVAGQTSNVKVRDFFSHHDKVVVVVDTNLPNRFINVYGTDVESRMIDEVRRATWTQTPSLQAEVPLESYLVYASQKSTYYVVELPL